MDKERMLEAFEAYCEDNNIKPNDELYDAFRAGYEAGLEETREC